MGREFIPFLKQKHGSNIPVVTILIGMSWAEERALRMAGLDFELPEPIEVDALLDTGAHRSFVPREYVNRLGLFPMDQTPVSQPLAQTTMVDLYAISIKLVVGNPRGDPGWRTVGLAPTVQAGVLPDRGNDGPRNFPMPIVGRDVLAKCTFTYHGVEERIELQLPGERRRGIFRWW